MNLRELAQVLDLSQTTVSRALNGYPEVSEATRQRVSQAARLHGYHPNSRAKGLATGRAMVIGHVIPASSQHELVNPIFGDFIAGAAARYAAQGYDLMLTPVAEGKTEETYRSLVRRHAVDGIILQSPQICERRIPLLAQLGIPFVVHGRSSAIEQPYCWVDVNNRRAFQRATNFLLDLGHKRIALINGLEALDFAARRRAGYSQALQDRGLALDPSIMFSEEMTESYGYRAMRHLLGLDSPPTGVLVASLITALGVRRALEEAGLKMGEQVSVATHDDALSYMQNDGAIPSFTAVRSSVRLAGQEAADMLIRHIQQPDLPASQLLLEAELVVGASTGPAPV